MSNKVARVAVFRNISTVQFQAAMYNLEHRMMPIIRKHPALLFGVWTANVDNTGGISFFVAPDAAAAQDAGMAINSAPLLPGQIAEDIPQPELVHNCAVIGEIDHGLTPGAARLAYNGVAEESSIAPDTRWLFDEFLPFLSTLPGLTQAYLLLDVETRQRISMTFWKDTESIAQSEQAVMAWSEQQVANGAQPAFRPEAVITDANILFVERGGVTTPLL
jgi:heme-degrading monooxygenase HmoA